MNSMVFSFIKRAVIVPLLLAAVSVAGLFLFVTYTPDFDKPGADDGSVVFQTKDFDKLSELSEGDYVGKLTHSENALEITYAESVSTSLVAEKNSSEPWSNGTVIITGTSAAAQLGDFRSAKKGDCVSLEVYSKGRFEYKITDIKTGLTLSDLQKIKSDKALLLCRSYNDFSTEGSAKLYAVYVAKPTGEVKK